MLAELQLTNYTSYEKLVIDLSNMTLVEIIGDNGCGKSYLLESILYILYGKVRYKLGMENLMRNGCGDTMEGLLRIQDLPEPGDLLQVQRSRTQSGVNTLKLYVNGEIMGKNSEAQGLIEQYMGLNVDLFTLTTFFGAGENDKLMSVTPATRLDTLQTIANVSVYEKLRKKAAEKLAEVRLEKENTQAALNELVDTSGEVKRATRALRLAKKDLALHDADLEDFSYQKAQLDSMYERVQSFVRSKLVLESELKSIQSQLDQTQEDIEESSQSQELYRKTVKQFREELESLPDKSAELADLGDAKTRLSERLAGINAVLDSTLSEEVDTCPTCLRELTNSEYQVLFAKRQELLVSKESTNRSITRRNAQIKDLKEYQYNRTQVEARLLSATRSLESVVSELETSQKQTRELKRRFTEKDTKLSSLLKKLQDNSGDDLVDRIADVDSKISICREKIGECRATIHLKRREVKTLSRKLDRVDKLKRELRTLTQKEKSYTILEQAWSRYGIPMDLTEGLREELEERATELYQNFQSGVILAKRVVDRGRPGIDFILSDSLGERSFRQLSKGQKTMMYLSVRLALVDIVAECMPFKVDWLVLDEIMDGLDPKQRDHLTTIMKKILRKRFTQIFSVSHVSVKSIFENKIEVHLENNCSLVEVT